MNSRPRTHKVIDATLIRSDKKIGTNWKGNCVHCWRPAAKEVHFKAGGITVIERYCEQCLEPSQFQLLQKWYRGQR